MLLGNVHADPVTRGDDKEGRLRFLYRNRVTGDPTGDWKFETLEGAKRLEAHRPVRAEEVCLEDVVGKLAGMKAGNHQVML